MLLRHAVLLGLAAAAAGGLGCDQSRTFVQADSPEMAAWVELVMPAQIKILEWTKPVSLVGDGNPDTIETIVEARDSFDDLTKVVGTFHFELTSRRLSDRMGTRVAFWPVEITTEDAMRMYRDPLSRFYHFPLQLEERLAPGRYVLNVWLILPGGSRLLDEYEFEYAGGPVPLATSF
jgi:hypothetical protein